VRWLAYHALRREEACEGPGKCGQVTDVECRSCGHGWRPADLRKSEPCPACGERGWRRQRCADCPTPRLEEALATAAAGPLLSRAIEIDQALDAGFAVTLADVTAEEWRALMVLREERAKYRKEKDQVEARQQGWPQS
jgi:predicted RNA-binding Zn-ribbon protein involved in translation (DUF1610 family)